jgi:Icc-related predicted phosphoesterase
MPMRAMMFSLWLMIGWLMLDRDLWVDDPDIVMVAGDWHGSPSWAEACFQHAYSKGVDVIVHAGDFGFWVDNQWTAEYLRRVEQAAQEWNIPILWACGNHEDHSRRHEFNSPDRPMTTYLARGDRWTWWGKRFMALGGAFSVDRFMRTEGVGWWPEEELSNDEIEHASRHDGHQVDVVIAHDCPTGVFIPGIGADAQTQTRGDWPDHMLAGALKHRDKVRRVWEATRPKLWVHGHYHRQYELEYEGTRFVGLDCDGRHILWNTMLLTSEDV